MAVGHTPAGVLVDDHHFLLLDHVVLIAAEAELGVQSAFNVLVQFIHGVRMRAARRVGVAGDLLAELGELDFLLSSRPA